MEKIDLVDFTAEEFNVPLNLEPIPGGYQYPFSFTIP